MKWLALTFLLVLTVTAPAKAEQPPTAPALVPIGMSCAERLPDTALKEQFGEIPFIEGPASIFINPRELISGTFRMYMSPTPPHSYTIFFIIKDEFYCLLMTGDTAGPANREDGI